MTYDAILFDNDGVLVEPPDLEQVHGGIRETFVTFGIEDPPQEHVEALLGATVDTVETVCATHDLDPRSFWYRRDVIVSRIQREAFRRGQKGLYPDVQVTREATVPQGIVTNNQRDTIRFIVEHFDLSDAFQTVYGREPTVEGLRRKKPNPYLLRRAIADLGAERPLFVGDSESDIAAAARMGIDSAFVRRDHRADYELSTEPTYEVTDLTDVIALLDDNPVAGD
ncbi:MAG: HAD family hydrolase [Halobacteriales archaeon]|nr:HAD family hydrolase [Halobacteriales archaeon]